SRKLSSGGVHYALLDRLGLPREADHDGRGDDVIAEMMRRHPGCDFFVIGPCTSTGRYLRPPDAIFLARLTMQGGCLGSPLYPPSVRLAQFEGKVWMPTFNLNGDRKGADVLMAAPIADRRFVGKNVCHTIVYNQAIHDATCADPPNAAAELFM